QSRRCRHDNALFLPLENKNLDARVGRVERSGGRPRALTLLMYRKILVALENSQADQSLLPHVTELAKRLQSHLLLVHVADGWVARNFDKLKLAESDEMKADRAYLETTAARMREHGLSVTTHLALGDPP